LSYLAARKFPFERGLIEFAALADEDAAIGALNYSCDDCFHSRKTVPSEDLEKRKAFL